MSRSIDERVVQMRFDNRQFQAGVDQTLKDVEKLNKGLKFEGASKGLEEVNKEVKKLDMSGFEKSVEVVITKMQTLGTIGMTIVQRLTNAVLDFGKKTVDAFAIEPVTTGFDEYQQKMGSVQTIMSATGASVQTVNKYLDELNEYSDKTIYSFKDMTSNIGKFTNAGVGLDDAVAAIKGVSNEAALAGANANEASRAMYNFAQALATGSVKLIDWKSIENANMATVSFKEELLKTAEEMGTVKKDANGMYQVLTKNAGGASMKTVMNATRNFNDSLSYQWMTSKVLIETLKRYSDETTEIGQKAYAAAMDVKTFSMMVDTLKEAAQSGWAETWQLIIGDFEEAKQTWTTFTEFFSDIISNSAKARNELIESVMLLQNDEGVSGREAIWQSLLNILESVRNILGAVKQAWQEVFPPVTDQKLRGIIESFKIFTEHLKENELLVSNIKKIFKGIFNVLNIFITLVRVAFHVSVGLIKELLGVFETLFFAGFSVLLDWIKRVQTAESGFNGWVNGIIKGIKKFVDYIKNLDGLTLTNVLKVMSSFVTDVIGSVFNFDAIASMFNDIGSKIANFFMITLGVTNDSIEQLKASGNSFVLWLISARDKLIEIFNKLSEKITFNSIVGVAIGVGLTLIVLTFKKFLDSITGVFEGIGEVFGSLGDLLSAKAKQIKAAATATLLLSIAGSILMLVAALSVLVKLASNGAQFYIALTVLTVLIAGIVGIMFALTKIDNKKSVSFAAIMVAFGVAMISLARTLDIIQGIETKGILQSLVILTVLLGELLVVGMLIGSSEKQYTVGAMTLLGFALALSLMVGALKKINAADLKHVSKSLNILFTIVTALAVLGIAFRNVKIGAAFTLLAGALVISQIMKTMAKFAEIDTDAITKALVAIGSIFEKFALLMLLAGLVTNTLTNFSMRLKGGVKLGYKANDSLKQLGSALIAMAASVAIIAFAIKLIGKVDDSDISKALTFIKGVTLCFAALVAVSIFAGKNADKAGKMLTKMASAMLKLTLVIFALSLFTDEESVKTPLKVITQLMLVMSVIVAATALVPNVDNMIDVFKGIAIAVAAMGAVLLVLSLLRNDNMVPITIMLSSLMIVFGLVVAMTGQAKDVHKTIILMTIAMVAMAALVAIMSELGLKDTVSNAASLGIMLLSLAGSLAILNKASNSFNAKVLAKFVVIAAIMSAIEFAIGGLEKLNFSVSIQNAVSLGIMILALSKALSILDGVNVSMDSVLQLGIISGILIVLEAVIGFFETAFTTLDGPSISVSIQNAISLGLLILAMSTSMKLLNGVEVKENTMITLAIMAAIMVALIALIGLIEVGTGGSSLSFSIQNAISIGLLMLALSASMKIMDGVEVKENVIGTIAVMGLILVGLISILAIITSLGGDVKLGIDVAVSLGLLIVAIGASTKILNGTKIDGSAIAAIAVMGLVLAGLMTVVSLLTSKFGEIKLSIETAASLSILLIAMSAACVISSTIGGHVGEAILGAVALAAFIAIMGALMWGIGELVRSNPNIMKDLEFAVQVFQKIGEAFGAIIGGFVKGVFSFVDDLLFKKIGEYIATLVDTLKTSLETLSGVDASATENLKNLMTAILILTANNALSTLLSFFTGKNSMEKFAAGMEALGDGITSFSAKTANMVYNETTISYAMDLLRELITISKSIPNTGGLLGAIVGNNDLDVFASQFGAVADGIITFSDRTSRMPYNKTTTSYALELLGDLIDLSRDVPNEGLSVASILLGDNRIEDFAKQFGAVADGIVTFSDRVKDMQYSTVRNIAALEVIRQLIDLAQDIPNQGFSFASVFVGDNKIGDFAVQFPLVGQGIAAFCAAIYSMYYQKEKTDAALSIIKQLVEVAGSISDKSVSWITFWSGNNNTGDFASQFPLIGQAIAEFSKHIHNGVRESSVKLSEFALKIFTNAVRTSKDTRGLKVDDAKKMKNFALELTWVGAYLLNYSKQIDAIKDLGVVEKSMSVITSMKDLVDASKNMDYGKFNQFQTTLIDFANKTFTEFAKAFETADTDTIVKNLTTNVISGIHENAGEFSKEGRFLVNTFISSIKIKMSELKATGQEMGDTFLSGLYYSLDVNSPSERTKWIGEMALLGFSDGLNSNKYDPYDTGVEFGDSVANGAQDKLGVHSHSDLFKWLGEMCGGGMVDGLQNSTPGIFSTLDSWVDGVKQRGVEGREAIQNIWGDIGSPIDIWEKGTGWAKDKVNEIAGNFLPEGTKFDFTKPVMEQVQDMFSNMKSPLDDMFDGMMDGTTESAKKSASEIAEALKLELHKHFDSKEFLYLGEQLGETMAIATNNAIVSKMKATSPLSDEIIAITAEGLDKWKAWLETRKEYDMVAQTDELAGWVRIQQMYVEGTKERMEADKEVYKLQKELVKGTYEYSKKWIDNEKYYERLSLEEELAAWERIQARYMEGSEQRIEAEKELYRIRKELRQKDYEDQKKWIEREKKFERLSLADELAAYLRIRSTTTEGSDERLEMDEKVYDLQKQIYEAEQQYIKDVAEAQKEAADERVRLEQEYADKVKSINEKLASDIAQLNENYANEVDQRKKSLYSSYGLFDAVEQQDFDKDELMKNLEDQVRAFEEWQMTINNLAARGLDKALIDELTEMGPSAAGQIRALNDMTDAELGQYNLLWSEKSMLAREQAVSELEELRIQTSENIAKLQQDSAKELDDYRKTWADNMAKITSNCEEKLAQLKQDFGETVGTIKKDTEGKMREMVETANRILREAGWSETGEQIVNGIVSGMNKNKTKVALAAGAIATLAITALNSRLKIKSPSKVTEESGEYVGEGFIRGIESYYDRVWESGRNLGEELQNGAFEAIKYVNNLLEDGMDSSVTITPVFDLTNVRSGIGDMQSMLDASKAVNLATSANVSLDQSRDLSFINPNEKVVQELQNMRKDLGMLGEQVASMQLVMDTGAVVGEITAPLDAALGSRIIRNTRERG